MNPDKYRRPYVGSGAEGARRSAQVDREEADVLDALDPARRALLASASRWDEQAADLEARNARPAEGLLNLAVIDLETTGSDEEAGSILEVGLVIATPDLEVLAERSWLVRPAEGHLGSMPQVVIEMHERSGLLDEFRGIPPWRFRDVEVVDGLIAGTLAPYTIGGKLALSGSGVGHFDGRWIRRHLPQTAKRLTYWPYDAGVVRRFLRNLVGAPEDLFPAPEDKPHRGLDDARLHLAELRAYRDLVREGLDAIAALRDGPV